MQTLSSPRSFSWGTGRPIIFTRVKGDFVRLGLANRIGKRGVLERKVGLAEIVSGQEVAGVSGEAVPADEVAAEPDALVVLDAVVLGGAEAEAVRRAAVLVVDHLGPLALPADVGGGLDLEVAVLAGADVLGLVVLDPYGDVLPVVAVADVPKVGHGDVLYRGEFDAVSRAGISTRNGKGY